MRRRSRHFAVLSAILIVLMAGAMLVGCDKKTTDTTDTTDGTTAATGEPYKIGVVISLTGAYAAWGDSQQKTLEMEEARINAAGGVHGRPIELIIEDDATDPEEAVPATTRLIDQEEVIAIIGSSGTGASMAMRPEIEAAEIPELSLAGASVITAEFSPWVFQTPWPNGLIVPFLLDYLDDQGISSFGLIADSGGFGGDGVAVIEGNIDDFDVEMVASETFNPDDTDMTAQLTSIRDAGAEAVVLWSAAGAATTVAKNMADLQMDVPLFGSHGNANKEFIEGAGDAAEGFRFPAGKILIPAAYGEGTEGYDVATSYHDRYMDEYDEAPDTFGGHSYDGLYLIVEAMKRLPEEFTPSELRDEIENTSDWVGIGGTFTFSDTDHNGLSTDDFVMYEVVDGEWTLAE